jgi:hypothetical protein
MCHHTSQEPQNVLLFAPPRPADDRHHTRILMRVCVVLITYFNDIFLVIQ